MELLTHGNPKTMKGEGSGFLTAILHLAPYNLSGRNVCPFASAGCAAACLNTSGRGGIAKSAMQSDARIPDNAIQRARIARTNFYFSDRSAFLAQLSDEIAAHVRRARKHGMKPAVRLNGTSDIPWESVAPELFDRFADVQFYDYTKSTRRMERFKDSLSFPANYHLTFSHSETNRNECRTVLSQRDMFGHLLIRAGSVAVVFDVPRGKPLPARFDLMGFGDTHAYRVIDGDATDLRFTDPAGVIVGLRAKGRARKDQSGFVVKVA